MKCIQDFCTQTFILIKYKIDTLTDAFGNKEKQGHRIALLRLCWASIILVSKNSEEIVNHALSIEQPTYFSPLIKYEMMFPSCIKLLVKQDGAELC